MLLKLHASLLASDYFFLFEECAKQYVGETKREFKYRMDEHVRDAHVNRERTVAIHSTKLAIGNNYMEGSGSVTTK